MGQVSSWDIFQSSMKINVISAWSLSFLFLLIFKTGRDEEVVVWYLESVSSFFEGSEVLLVVKCVLFRVAHLFIDPLSIDNHVIGGYVRVNYWPVLPIGPP